MLWVRVRADNFICEFCRLMRVSLYNFSPKELEPLRLEFYANFN